MCRPSHLRKYLRYKYHPDGRIIYITAIVVGGREIALVPDEMICKLCGSRIYQVSAKFIVGYCSAILNNSITST